MKSVAVALALALAGCGGATRRSEDPMARDQEILRDVSWKLRQDTRFERVQATCREGVVLLHGVVTLPSDREDAARIAWSVKGVKEVLSKIETRGR